MTNTDQINGSPGPLPKRVTSSITTKVVLTVTAVFILSASVFVYSASQTGTAMLERLARSKAEDVARICLATVEEIMNHRDQHLLDSVLGLSMRTGVAEAVVVVRHDGTFRTATDYRQDPAGLPLMDISRRESVNDTSLTVQQKDTLYMWLVRPVVRRPECRSCHQEDRPLIGHLAVKVSIDNLRPLADEHRWSNIIMSSLAFLLLGGAVLAAVLRLVVRPVNALRARVAKLIEQVQGIERGESVESNPVPVRSPQDEISELAAGFNHLVARLNVTHSRVREAHRTRLEEASRLALVGERAARIVHDVRNPIMGVVGALQVMEGEAAIEDQYKPIVREITVQLRRTSVLLNDLLASARPAEAMIEPVDLNDIVQSTLTVFSAMARERNISVEQQLATAMPPIEADPKLVQQLVWNILTNAIDAESAGGRVSVSTAWRGSADPVPGWPSLQQDYAGMRVRDTGKGIRREDIAGVFEPFQTARADGTGLGLSIARRIVDLHNGTIEIESTPAMGTAVTILLPCKKKGV